MKKMMFYAHPRPRTQELHHPPTHSLILLQLLIIQQLLNISHHIVRRNRRSVAFHWHAVAIDEKLGEIPLNSVDQRTTLLLLQPLKQRMSIATVYVHLRVHIKCDTELLMNPTFDLRFIPRFLATKLIARKCSNAKALTLIFRKNLLQLCVILVG